MIGVAMNKQTQEAFGSDAQLEKHAKEYHGLTLNQFKLMCEEAHKRYEGQFSNSVDKALAVESFYEGFKVAIKEALEEPAWQGLTDDEIQNITWKIWGADALEPELDYARAIEQALKEKNHA
jgi:hypothetical protein